MKSSTRRLASAGRMLARMVITLPFVLWPMLAVLPAEAAGRSIVAARVAHGPPRQDPLRHPFEVQFDRAP